MRTLIGWMAAMVASALLGAAVYQTVLSRPLADVGPAATVETISQEPSAVPTVYRTEIQTVVDPTPTVTVEDRVLIAEEVVQTGRPRTSKAAPARTPAPTPRATAEREDRDSTEDSDDSHRDSTDEAEGDDSASESSSGSGSEDRSEADD